MANRAVIAGIGHTAYGALPGRSTISLAAEAFRLAIQDAGIAKDMVDALFVKYPSSHFEFMYAQRLAEAFGLQPRIVGGWDQGGASNISMISFAAMAIEAGQCDIAVVCYSDNPKTGNRSRYQRPRGDSVFGLFGVLAGYAMIARCHMLRHGTRPEDLAAVAIASRRHGAANPHAQLRKPLTLDAYMAAPYNVAPLRRDDCALISDGGAAVVVMSERRARELQVRAPVPILGYGQAHTSWDVTLRPDLTSTAASISAAKAFEMAGIGPKDIDVAQIYDCFTITVLMTLEDYGFCRKGEVGRFVEGGRIEIGGELPINTAGGLLSETGMPGLQLVIEGVRQMRGEATLQVRGAKKCLISNQGGVMHTHASLILGQ